MEEGELRLSLLDFLRPSESCPHGVLLLVDEAHTLPLQLLDEIRMITNLVRDGQPRVRLVLAGDAQLDDIFADPRLDSFNQRIAARCYLEPLNQEQTIEYVRAQIDTNGSEPSRIFTDDALVSVHRASGGIPRLINQVCDHAMVMASLGGYHQLDAGGIEEAWADLQQLPGPWNDPAVQSNDAGDSIVEFGSLDEMDPVSDEPLDELDGGIELVGGELPEPSTSTPDHITSIATSDQQTLPDPANEVPLPLDAANSIASEPDVSDPEVEPVAHDNPQPSAQDVGIDYFESNIVQMGWEPKAQEPPGPVAPTGDTDTEIDATQTSSLAVPPRENALEYIDPFGQGFEEEEVVIDRYADVEGSVFTGCPRVSSEEGRSLASIIEHQAKPQLSVVEVDSVDEADVSYAQSEPVEVTVDEIEDTESAHENVEVTEELAEAADECASAAELAEQPLANHVIDTASLSNWLFGATTEIVDAGVAKPVQSTSDEDELPEIVIETESSESLLTESVSEPHASNAPEVSVSPAHEEPPILQVHDGQGINDDRDMIIIDYDKNDGVFLTQSGHYLPHRVEYQQLFSQLRHG